MYMIMSVWHTEVHNEVCSPCLGFSQLQAAGLRALASPGLGRLPPKAERITDLLRPRGTRHSGRSSGLRIYYLVNNRTHFV